MTTPAYDQLVKSIVEYLKDEIQNDVKEWEGSFLYAGFDPKEIAKKLVGIPAKDLVMLCVITIMRGTKVSKILDKTEGSTLLERFRTLATTYNIVDTGRSRTRETVNLSRIIATFPITTLAAASKMEAIHMGIYYAACPNCPWLGLAGAVMLARSKPGDEKSKVLIQGHIGASALVTWKATNLKDGLIERAAGFARIINSSQTYDKDALKYVKDTLYEGLYSYIVSDDFANRLRFIDTSLDRIPAIDPKPL